MIALSASAFASEGRYTLGAPEGWTIDTESGKPQGLHVVLYPKTATWSSGTVVMYANTASKKQPGNESAEKVMNADIESFKRQAPHVKVGPVRHVKTRHGKTALVRDFARSVGGNYESVAYIDEPQSVVILALSARTEAEHKKALTDFDKLVGSYALINRAHSDTYAAVEEAFKKATLDRATRDSQTEKGRAYSRTVGQAFGKVHEKMIIDCIKSTRAADEGSIDFVVKVGSAGQTSEVLALEKNVIAHCLKSKLEAMKWPEPPFAPFHARVSLKLK